jgi:hypothetical protein
MKTKTIELHLIFKATVLSMILIGAMMHHI